MIVPSRSAEMALAIITSSNESPAILFRRWMRMRMELVDVVLDAEFRHERFHAASAWTKPVGPGDGDGDEFQIVGVIHRKWRIGDFKRSVIRGAGVRVRLAGLGGKKRRGECRRNKAVGIDLTPTVKPQRLHFVEHDLVGAKIFTRQRDEGKTRPDRRIKTGEDDADDRARDRDFN